MLIAKKTLKVGNPGTCLYNKLHFCKKGKSDNIELRWKLSDLRLLRLVWFRGQKLCIDFRICIATFCKKIIIWVLVSVILIYNSKRRHIVKRSLNISYIKYHNCNILFPKQIYTEWQTWYGPWSAANFVRD